MKSFAASSLIRDAARPFMSADSFIITFSGKGHSTMSVTGTVTVPVPA
jgi:hypothetical protein